MNFYRLFLVVLILHGQQVHGWEVEQSHTNRPHLQQSLNHNDKHVQLVAQTLLTSHQKVVNAIAPLLTNKNKELVDAGIDLATIAISKSHNQSAIHAVIALGILLQESNASPNKKAQGLIERLKNSTEAEENTSIAREAKQLHKAHAKQYA